MAQHSKIHDLAGGDHNGVPQAVEDNLLAFDNSGLPKDSGYAGADFEPTINPKGTAFNADFGTGAGDVCEGDDARLSDTRDPNAHALSGTAHTGITATENNFMAADANGKPKDSGYSASSFQAAGTAIQYTSDGGLAIKMKAGENLATGEIVCSPQAQQIGGNDGEVYKCPTATNEKDMPIGVVHTGVNSGADVWVVVAGKVKMLPEAGITAARGYIAYASSGTAGRAAQSATAPVNDHWREVGHWIATGSGDGVATLAVVHFN